MAEAKELLAALKKVGDDDARALDILNALDGAEVTVGTLQELRIGAFVAKFKKSPDAGVADAAKSLIKKWKSLAAEAGVQSTRASSPRASSAAASSSSAARGGDEDEPAVSEPSSKPASKPTAAGAFTTSLGDFRSNARKRFLDVLVTDESRPECYAVAEAIEAQLDGSFPRAASDANQKRDYVAKLRQLSFNIKKNDQLRARLLSGDVSPERLNCMSVEELATQELQEERERMAQYQHDARSLDWDKKNRDRINKSIGVDESKGMFQCKKCKSKRIANHEKQTRSADEPMTQFFECADCGNRWRF